MDGGVTPVYRDQLRLIDWPTMGIVFRRHGYGHYRVASILNLPPSTVRGWFNTGSEPSFSNGMRCVRLFVLSTGQPLPRLDPHPMTASDIGGIPHL